METATPPEAPAIADGWSDLVSDGVKYVKEPTGDCPRIGLSSTLPIILILVPQCVNLSSSGLYTYDMWSRGLSVVAKEEPLNTKAEDCTVAG